MTAGALRIAASARDGATVVDTLRRDGLAWCSRPFAEPGGAARIVVSQLGPGYVRGDRFALDGILARDASLVLASQAASRLLGRGAASEANARFDLAEGARLAYVPEPTVAYAGAAHRARTAVHLQPGASLAWLDTLAAHGTFERVTSSLQVFFGDALAVHDAYDLEPRHVAAAVGTALFVRSGMTAERSIRLVAAADAAATLARTDPDIAVGVASPAVGGVFVRATGRHAGAIRSVLANVLAVLRRIDAVAESPPG